MQQFFETGRVIDLVFAFMAVEIVLLMWWRRVSGRGLRAQAVVLALLPGLMLLAAARLTLAKASWPIIALVLVLALLAHIADLRQRIRAS